MTRASTEFHEKASFRIKHDDERLFTKLLSKETSKAQPSFRVYYGDVSSAVPFTWETIPGTPKHRSHGDSDLPPLTPPPSYYTNGGDLATNKTCKRSSSRSKLHHLILRAMTLRRVVVHPKKEVHAASYPSSTSSLSSLSWSSSSSSSDQNSRRRRRFSSWGSSFDDRAVVDNPSEEMRSGPAKKVRGGYYSSVKKALLSVVGRGSN